MKKKCAESGWNFTRSDSVRRVVRGRCSEKRWAVWALEGTGVLAEDFPGSKVCHAGMFMKSRKTHMLE